MNKVILSGNLTRDPELTETSAGVSICRFSMAVNRKYKNADGDTITDFFNCTAWRGLGDTIARFAKKGKKIAVVGSVEMRNYEDRDGNKRTAVDINVQEVEFLSPKDTDDEDREAKPIKPSSRLQSFDDDSDILF